MNHLFYLDTFSYHVFMNFLLVIIIILIPFAVITRVFRRKSWKREIPTYMFCHVGDFVYISFDFLFFGNYYKTCLQQIFIFMD